MLKRVRAVGFSIPMMIAIGVGLALLLGFTVYRLFYSMRNAVNYTIVENMDQLEKILKEIDTDCEIISVAHDRNYIDFLQVATFVGSRVGPLNLRRPEKWKGPYLTQNPEVQDLLYELVKVKHGYALVPGEGVVLANGKKIGTDIIFTPNTDIDSLLTEEIGLEWQGAPLARMLMFKNIQSIPVLDEQADNEI